MSTYLPFQSTTVSVAKSQAEIVDSLKNCGFTKIAQFDVEAANKAKAEYEKFERDNPVKTKQEFLAKKSELASLDQKIVSDRQTLEALLLLRTSRLAEFTPQQEAKRAEIADLEGKIDESIDTSLATAVESLGTQRETLDTTTVALAQSQTTLTVKLSDRDRRDSLLNDRAAEEQQLAGLLSDQADWIDLDDSLSRNGGFQSIMVESAGAQMVPFMNRMLEHYGRNWTMDIATSFPTADGKAMREGFRVTINRPEGPEDLGDLSGGEESIADQVIYDAITDMLRRRSGLHLQTAIRDEADGRLDEQRAANYLRAIEAAHALSGIHHTLYITHRSALQALITQCILFDPDNPQGITTRIN